MKEAIVFLSAAILISALLFGVAKQSETKEEILSMDASQFVTELVVFWEICSYGEGENFYEIYVKESGTIDKSYIFELIKLYGYCDTLQSSINSCGKREDIEMNAIYTPGVISMTCKNGKIYLE
jgi:hypothetical protein